jgi:hypothetical protein
MVEFESYLGLSHLVLHAADTALHCATQDPDSPQFCAQEKLFELQFEMHSAGVWVCASRSFSINVAASVDVIPNNQKSTTTYLMVWPPKATSPSLT